VVFGTSGKQLPNPLAQAARLADGDPKHPTESTAADGGTGASTAPVPFTIVATRSITIQH
jgi:hypothetical protein